METDLGDFLREAAFELRTCSVEIEDGDVLGQRTSLGKGSMANRYTIYVQRTSVEALLWQIYREAEISCPLLESELGIPGGHLSSPTLLSPCERSNGFDG